jgi:RNA polymerase sigma factor (TIGR02999 family)
MPGAPPPSSQRTEAELTGSAAATVTRLLADLEGGRREALDELLPLVYAELHAQARRQRGRWRGDPTLDTTALVHEAYLKLVGQERVAARSRAHFLGLAAKAMRHILCNYARDRQRKKRGGGAVVLPLDERLLPPAVHVMDDEHADVLIALEAALSRLGAREARQERIVECRFFGGLSIEDTAAALDLSPATVKRDWALARAWLFRELQRELHSA